MIIKDLLLQIIPYIENKKIGDYNICMWNSLYRDSTESFLDFINDPCRRDMIRISSENEGFVVHSILLNETFNGTYQRKFETDMLELIRINKIEEFLSDITK